MKLLICLFLSSLIWASETNISPTPTAAGPVNKLEELILWKMSEELRLPTAQEKKFAEVLRDLSNLKQDLTKRLEADLENLRQAKGTKARQKALRGYRQSLGRLQKLPLMEIDRLRTLLGEERLTRYLVVKSELAGKVKALLVEKAENHDENQVSKPDKIDGSSPDINKKQLNGTPPAGN